MKVRESSLKVGEEVQSPNFPAIPTMRIIYKLMENNFEEAIEAGNRTDLEKYPCHTQWR